MNKLWIIGLLALCLFIPNANADINQCEVYDDFSVVPLNEDKWEEVVVTNIGQGYIEEHWVIDGVYHTAQISEEDRAKGIGLVFKNMVFKSEDIIEYDIDYVSGSNNGISTILLKGRVRNIIPIVSANNDYGVHHVKLTFAIEGLYGEITRPDGSIDILFWSEPSTDEYTFGMVTKVGNKGLVHMDYDNVIICTDSTEEVPEFGSIITVLMTSLMGIALLRPKMQL